MAVLHGGGISPDFRDFLQIVVRGWDSASEHFFSSMAGNSSGPGAELGDNSSIASMRSRLLKEILLRIGEEGISSATSGNNVSVEVLAWRGVLKTELYCSLRISAISRGALMSCLVEFIRGPIPTRTLEHFFA